MFDCLIMDHCTVHKREEFIKLLDDNNVKYFFIPPGCTGLAQPLDVSVNKSLKSGWNSKYSEFLTSNVENKVLTKSGKVKPPSCMHVPDLQVWGYLACAGG